MGAEGEGDVRGGVCDIVTGTIAGAGETHDHAES